MDEENVTIEAGSGNVFADLGFPNAEEELLKAQLTVRIFQLIGERKLKQTEAAALLGTTQPQVSALMRCRAGAFSVERLMRFSTILGQDVEVVVRPRAVDGGRGRLSVIQQPEAA